MKITIGTTDLALGANRNEPSVVQGLEGARQLDVQPLTRSAEPGIYSRANVSHTLTVAVTRHHATAAAAADYVLSHAAAVWGYSGTLTCESPSGNKWTLSQASIERCSLSRWNGKTTVHAYTIRGGLLAAVVVA